MNLSLAKKQKLVFQKHLFKLILASLICFIFTVGNISAQIFIGGRYGVDGVNLSNLLKSFTLGGENIDINLEKSLGKQQIVGLDLIGIDEYSGFAFDVGLGLEGLNKKEFDIISQGSQATLEASPLLFSLNLAAGMDLITLFQEGAAFFLAPTIGITYGSGKNPTHSDAFNAFKTEPTSNSFKAASSSYIGPALNVNIGFSLNEEFGLALKPGISYRFLGEGVEGGILLFQLQSIKYRTNFFSNIHLN